MSLGSGRSPAGAGLPAPFMASGSSSFTEFLGSHAPELLPSGRPLPPGGALEAPHGTTIVTLTFDGGVVMAGDRRATMGNLIANRDMQKVFGADDYSAVGIAGTAGLAIELVKLFQVELEHYEKIEGTLLSLEGKANRLATMIRSNLGMAMQGLAVVPLFAGFDLEGDLGRIFSYDVTGGCYEEHDHHSVGSGSLFARGALKKLWRPGLDAADRHPGGGRGAVRRRRRRLRHGRAGPRAADLADAGGRRRPGPALRAGRPARRRGRADRVPPSRQPRRCAMTMPFYVSPEQLMKDRADYARKGIARGRSVVVLGYEGGIAFVAENPSRALHKVSEIYDRLAFAAVGKYNEFENLRVAGVRYADLRGYSYDRIDVTARGLANAYAQTLGTVFTQESKPYEVEIAVAEVGTDADSDQIYRLTYDGSVADEHGFVAMGGATDPITEGLKQRWRPGMTLADALRLAVELLEQDAAGGPPRVLTPAQLEVAVLDRERPRRKFRRISGPLLDRLLNSEDPTTGVPREDEQTSGRHDTLTQGQHGQHAPTADPEGPEQPGPAQQ